MHLITRENHIHRKRNLDRFDELNSPADVDAGLLGLLRL
jgi:hypothetical protein